MGYKYLYLKVTKDRYQLPLAVADSPRELAALTGDDKAVISSMASRDAAGKVKRPGFVRVPIKE